MYSTVINKHSTVITHPVPQPTAVMVPQETNRAMAVDPSQTLPDSNAVLSDGAYSIPVKINSSASRDPTLSGYETPNFISKNEKKINQFSQEEFSNNIDVAVYLKGNMEKDITHFLTNLESKKNKSEKANECMILNIYKYYILIHNY
jgi:hypothetical protein